MQHLRDSKVTELDDVFTRQEDVLGFEVAVQDVLAVHVVQCTRNLRKPIQHQIFLEALSALLGVGNVLRQISIVSVLQHDVQAAVAKEVLVVPHDVRVVQRHQHTHFPFRLHCNARTTHHTTVV